MRGLRTFGATTLVVTLLVGAAACGDDDDEDTSGTPAEAGDADDDYTPVSDVDSHAAVGEDIAEIKELLDVAEDGQPVDWPAVKALFEEGSNSVKGDGSVRTLSSLVDAPDVVQVIDDAVAGTGDAAGADDSIRRQLVDKGMTALLRAKVLQELDAAAGKLADGDTDPESGAPHNVDEAWAFFTADGNGPAATADKRADDFDLGGEVREPVESALVAAQSAALDGDESAFDTAAAQVEATVNYIFYLATYKYLDTEDDDVRKVEGETFFLAIAETVDDADPEAHTAILDAFETGDAESGRAALHRDEVVEALGLTSSQLVS